MPAREVAHAGRRRALHAHGAEQLVDARLRHAVQAGVVAQVLAPAQLAIEQRLVAEVAHLPGSFQRSRGQLGAEHPGAPAVGAQQAGEHAQQRRLARAVAAQHRQRGARAARAR